MKRKYWAIIGVLVLLVITLTIVFFDKVDPIRRFAPMDEVKMVSDMSDFESKLSNMNQAVISLNTDNGNGEKGKYIFTDNVNMKKIQDAIGLMEIQYYAGTIDIGNSKESISIYLAYEEKQITVSCDLIDEQWYVSFSGFDDWKGYEDADSSYYKLKNDAKVTFMSLLADICHKMTFEDVIELSRINGLKVENFSVFYTEKYSGRLPESIKGKSFYYPVEDGYGVVLDYYYNQSYYGNTVIHASQIVNVWLINKNGESVSIKGNAEQVEEFINN